MAAVSPGHEKREGDASTYLNYIKALAEQIERFTRLIVKFASFAVIQSRFGAHSLF